MPGEDKTEKATPKRRNDERKKGNILFCQDIIAVSTLIGSVVMLRVMFGTFVTEISEFFAKCSRFAVGTMDSEPGYYMGELVFEGVKVFVSTAGPMLLATIFVALAATFAQTRFLVAGERIKPKLNKISPISGFKRVFSARSLVEA